MSRSVMKRLLACGIFPCVLLLSGCGTGKAGSSQTPRPSSPESPASQPSLVFVSVTTTQTATGYSTTDTIGSYTTGGVHLHSALFTPPSGPNFDDSSAVVPPAALIAGNDAYYATDTGEIMKFDPVTGANSVVGTVPFTNPTSNAATAEELSFAVNPAGTRVVALVTSVATGPSPTGPSLTVNDDADVTSTYYSWSGGRAFRTTGSKRASEDLLASGMPFLFGWDPAGPVVSVGNLAQVQNNGPNAGFAFGQLMSLDSNGTYGGDVGGSGCYPYAVSANWTIACSSNAPLSTIANTPPGSVKFWFASVSGATLWSPDPSTFLYSQGSAYPYTVLMNPNGKAAVLLEDSSTGQFVPVVAKESGSASFPSGALLNCSESSFGGWISTTELVAAPESAACSGYGNVSSFTPVTATIGQTAVSPWPASVPASMDFLGVAG